MWIDSLDRRTFLIFTLAALFCPNPRAESADEPPPIPVVCSGKFCTGRVYISSAAEKSLFCGVKKLDRTNQHPDMLLVYAGYVIGEKEHFYDTAFTAGVTPNGKKIGVREIDRVEIRSGRRRLCEADVF